MGVAFTTGWNFDRAWVFIMRAHVSNSGKPPAQKREGERVRESDRSSEKDRESATVQSLFKDFK